MNDVPRIPARRQCLLMGLAVLSHPVIAADRPLVALVNAAGRMSYLDEGQPRGAVVSLLNEAARRAGVDMEVRLVPRARLMALVDGGAYDLFGGTHSQVLVGASAPNLERSADFVPLFKVRAMLLFDRRLSAAAPQDMAGLMRQRDWRGLFVRGVGLAPANQTWIEQLEAQRRLTLVPDWASVIRMLLGGRAEFSVFSPTFLRGEIDKLPPEQRERLVTKALPDLAPQEVGLYVAHHVPLALRQRLLQQLEAIQREGLFRRWVQQEHPDGAALQDLIFAQPAP